MFDRILNIPEICFTSDGKRLSIFAYVFLAMLCLGFFTPGLVTLPPTDRDESLFAQASKQMIETGDYIDIRIQDVPRYKKPIGIYWLQAFSAQLLEIPPFNEIWAYRVPSLISATVAVLTTAALGSLLFSPLIGFLAALMLCGCVLMNVEARLAKTDSTLLATIILMQWALARTYLSRSTKWPIFLLFWTSIAVGILIKGPIILLVLFSTLLWLQFSDKSLSWFRSLKPWYGIIYTLILAAPWFITIMLQSHGEFASQSAGHDFLGKVWQGQGRGIMPPGLHALVFPILFFPFSLFAILSIPDSWAARREPAMRFCFGWLIPTWLIFELSLTKLPHYVLPTYPVIALLAAKGLCDGYPKLLLLGRRRLVTFAVALWLILGVGYASIFVILPYVMNDNALNILQIFAGFALIVLQGAALLYLLRLKSESVVLATLGSMLFLSSVFGSTLPSLQHFWLSRDSVKMAMEESGCVSPLIISAAYNEPSLIFLGGTDTKLTQSGAVAADELLKTHCSVALIDTNHKAEFLQELEKKGRNPGHDILVPGFDSGRGRKLDLDLFILPLPSKT